MNKIKTSSHISHVLIDSSWADFAEQIIVDACMSSSQQVLHQGQLMVALLSLLFKSQWRRFWLVKSQYGQRHFLTFLRAEIYIWWYTEVCSCWWWYKLRGWYRRRDQWYTTSHVLSIRVLTTLSCHYFDISIRLITCHAKLTFYIYTENVSHDKTTTH